MEKISVYVRAQDYVGDVTMQYKKDIIEKVNKDYLEIYQSQRYKLGDILFEILEGVKKFDLKKSISNLKLLTQGVRLQKYNISKQKRFIEFQDNYIAPKTAIYMALFGKYDKVLEPVIVSDNCDYYIFTDQDIDKNSIWKKVDLSYEQNKYIEKLSAIEKNRFFKMLGYQYFSDYKFSIYIDANMEIYGELSRFDVYANTRSGIAMYNHPARKCIYDEAQACIIMGKVRKKDAKIQMRKYFDQGMPKNYGMCECNVIVRQTSNMICKKLMKEWWIEFNKSIVKRDQIVFPYILWKNGININEIGCLGENVDHDGKFRRKMHL